MKLVIAEKPSVAMHLAKVIGVTEKKGGYLEGENYLVSWCIGHLVELMDASSYNERYRKWSIDDLPIIPDPWQYRVFSDKKKQFETVRQLMHRVDVDELICATDAGREGELIFRLTAELAGCKKPVLRLWVSSMEDSAIREAFQHLRNDQELDNLYASALCRAKADWIIGINATRLFSVLYHKTLRIGRVQTPVLNFLVKRDSEIAAFKKEPYYTVVLKLNGFEAQSARITDEKEAQNLAASCQNKPAVSNALATQQRVIKPPTLYDLTGLQKDANRLFGYTAKQTLDLAQSLYEKKLLTYPRTDSCYLTDDMKETVEKLIQKIPEKLPFGEENVTTENISKLFDNSNVSDHHAILPTVEFLNHDFSALPETEQKLLLLVAVRLLCAVSPIHQIETVTVTLTCCDQIFTAKGTTVIKLGWKELWENFLDTFKGKSNVKETTLPPLSEGICFDKVEASVSTHMTAPPKPYTEDTLLSAMENAGSDSLTASTERRGLGTPATRAAIIEKLIQGGFVVRKKRQLEPTLDGIHLITVLPEKLTSPELTSDWENQLSMIAKGEQDPNSFLNGIETMAKDLTATYSNVSKEQNTLFQPQRMEVGKCPRCGKPVYEGKKTFYCEDKNCGFKLWKNNYFFDRIGKTLTTSIVKELLVSGAVFLKGLTSQKTGKPYNATLILEDAETEKPRFKLEFSKKKEKRSDFKGNHKKAN